VDTVKLSAWTAALFLPLAVTAADDDLQACRRVAMDGARLACYDALADGTTRPGKTSLDDSRPTSVPTAAAPANTTPAAPSPEELFGRDATQSEQMVRQSAGIGRVEQITAQVTEVRAGTYGKLVVTLDNGQVWRQLDSPAPRMKAGDKVRIRRAALNSYVLVRAEGGRAIRVHRDR